MLADELRRPALSLLSYTSCYAGARRRDVSLHLRAGARRSCSVSCCSIYRSAAKRPLGRICHRIFSQSFVHESIGLLVFRPACIAHTVAILLHGYWAIYDPPSTSLWYVIHHTILVITISCKGQAATQRPLGRPSQLGGLIQFLVVEISSLRSDSPLHICTRASSADSTRSTHSTLTQRHR